ncbi:MAG: POTRA domain-containing protein [Bradyrhizobium sp.]|nr:POTRA domain-containing protein [Bradyrhizobium sp.]
MKFGNILAISFTVFIPFAASPALAQTVPSDAAPDAHIRERFTQIPAPDDPTVRKKPNALPIPNFAQYEAVRLNPAHIEVDGVSAYKQGDIAQLVASLEGHEISLADIYRLAATLTAKYRHDGYILSRVVVPPQQFSKDGSTIRLRALEGYINAVKWPAKAATYPDFFKANSRKITRDKPLSVTTLERFLLLANDLPGLTFRSTLQPATDQPAASTLSLDMTQQPISGQITVNNRGSEGRGPVQFIGSLALNNLAHQDESLGLTFATVPDARQLMYGALDFKKILNSEGLSLLVSPYYDSGFPGVPTLGALNYHSEAYGIEGGLSYPLVRSRAKNLTLFGVMFAENYQGTVSAGILSRDRLRGIRSRLIYDSSDSSPGINQAVLAFSQGIDGAGSTENGQPLASRAVGRVDFSKLNLTVNRTQFLPHSFSLYAGLDGQYAFNPLQPIEQCTFGGDHYGRAYDPSALVGDRCLAETGEIRFDFRTKGKSVTAAQVYGYADHGDLWTLEPAAGTPAHLAGTSVGGGLRVTLFTRLALSGEIGSRLSGAFSREVRGFFSATLKI